MKSSSKKASCKGATQSKPNTATTASAQTQSTTTNTPGTPQIPPPSQRPLEIWYVLHDGEGNHSGSLLSIRAEFSPWSGQVCIRAQSDDYRIAHLSLDHAATRAVLNGARRSLVTLARFDGWHGRNARLEGLRRFRASSYTCAQSSSDITVQPLPARDAIQLTAVCGKGARENRVDLYLTPLEAEALAFDLELALRDMERFSNLDS
jgi:hypothetical protein